MFLSWLWFIVHSEKVHNETLNQYSLQRYNVTTAVCAYIQFEFVLFWHKDIGAKVVRKMLVQLMSLSIEKRKVFFSLLTTFRGHADQVMMRINNKKARAFFFSSQTSDLHRIVVNIFLNTITERNIYLSTILKR